MLVILMHNFKVDKAIGYPYFECANMQGIKVKGGILFYKITLKFIDGTNYVIRMQKRNMKTLPNQRANSGEMVINSSKNRKFIKEFHTVMKTYHKTNESIA